nr:ORFX [Kanhgag paramyxovirus]
MTNTSEYVDMTQLSDHTYDTVNTHNHYYGSRRGLRLTSKKLQLIDNTYKLTSNLNIMFFIVLILVMINIICSILVPLYTKSPNRTVTISKESPFHRDTEIDDFTINVLKSKIDHMLQILSYRLPSDFQTFIRKLTEETIPLKIIDTLLSNTNNINLDLKLDKAKNLLFKISSVEADPNKLSLLYKWLRETKQHNNDLPIYTIVKNRNKTLLNSMHNNNDNLTLYQGSHSTGSKLTHLKLLRKLINRNVSNEIEYYHNRTYVNCKIKDSKRHCEEYNSNKKTKLKSNPFNYDTPISYQYQYSHGHLNGKNNLDQIGVTVDFLLSKIYKSLKVRYIEYLKSNDNLYSDIKNNAQTTTNNQNLICAVNWGTIHKTLQDIGKRIKSIEYLGFNHRLSNKYEYKIYTFIKNMLNSHYNGHMNRLISNLFANQNLNSLGDEHQIHNKMTDNIPNNVKIRMVKAKNKSFGNEAKYNKHKPKLYNSPISIDDSELLNIQKELFYYNFPIKDYLKIYKSVNPQDFKRNEINNQGHSHFKEFQDYSKLMKTDISGFQETNNYMHPSVSHQGSSYYDPVKYENWRKWSSNNGMRMNLKYNRFNLSIDDFDYSYYQFCGTFIKYKQSMVREILKFLNYVNKWLYCYDYNSVYTVIEPSGTAKPYTQDKNP